VKLLDRPVDDRAWEKARRLLLRQPRSEADVAPATQMPESARVRQIEFVAYAEDCTLSGQIALAGDRLSDVLNENERFVLVDVLVTDLAGGDRFEVHELQVEREDLLLVHATGPRGHAQRRRNTRQHPIVAKLGPYELRGYIHALPGSNAIDSLRRRSPIVAVADAIIDFSVATTRERRRVGTVLMNRDLTDWIVPGFGDDDELADLDLPVQAGPLVKDFTGAVLAWDDGESNGLDRSIA
jgi:hypothetical protein